MYVASPPTQKLGGIYPPIPPSIYAHGFIQVFLMIIFSPICVQYINLWSLLVYRRIFASSSPPLVIHSRGIHGNTKSFSVNGIVLAIYFCNIFRFRKFSDSTSSYFFLSCSFNFRYQNANVSKQVEFDIQLEHVTFVQTQ